MYDKNHFTERCNCNTEMQVIFTEWPWASYWISANIMLSDIHNFVGDRINME